MPVKIGLRTQREQAARDQLGALGSSTPIRHEAPIARCGEQHDDQPGDPQDEPGQRRHTGWRAPRQRVVPVSTSNGAASPSSTAAGSTHPTRGASRGGRRCRGTRSWPVAGPRLAGSRPRTFGVAHPASSGPATATPSGFRGISGRAGSLAWWGGVLFPAAVLLGLAAPVLVLTGTTLPLGTLAHPVVATAGLVVGIAGLAVVLLAQHGMGASWRIGVDDSERTELVTSGLFGRVRNPIFTGMAAVSAGVMLMAPTLARSAWPWLAWSRRCRSRSASSRSRIWRGPTASPTCATPPRPGGSCPASAG